MALSDNVTDSSNNGANLKISEIRGFRLYYLKTATSTLVNAPFDNLRAYLLPKMLQNRSEMGSILH